MKNGECAYIFESKPANGNSNAAANGETQKVYICVKENDKKICRYLNNYCACPKYEPR